MTSQDYPMFRERVTAKTNGANIHKVNGLLGNVLNSLNNMEYRITRQDYEGAAKCRDVVRESLKQIKILTGVSE